MSQVILAEDETQLRGLIAAMLTAKRVTVSEAADGVEALQLVKDQPGVAEAASRTESADDDGLCRRPAAAFGAAGARDPHPGQALRSRPDVRPGRGYAVPPLIDL